MDHPYVMYPDGTRADLKPVNGTDFTFEELYPVLGCDTIELLYLSDGTLMLFDEEGRLTGKPVNQQATVLITADLEKRGRFLLGGNLLGPVLHCGEDQIQ